jgi:hypothetical protein
MRRNDAKAMFVNACSARLILDFEPMKPLDEFPVFFHEGCRSECKQKEM